MPPPDLPALADARASVRRGHRRDAIRACRRRVLRVRAAHRAGGSRWRWGSRRSTPTRSPRLDKQCRLDDFAPRRRLRLRHADIGVRAFVLVGAPFVPADEAVAWAVRSAAWALDQGADVVALIPVRGGNGELERLAAAGDVHAADAARSRGGAGRRRWRLGRGGVVLADLWDADAPRRPAGRAAPPRIERLARMNAQRGASSPRSLRRLRGREPRVERGPRAGRRRRIGVRGRAAGAAARAPGPRRHPDRARPPPALRDRRVVDAARQPLPRAPGRSLRPARPAPPRRPRPLAASTCRSCAAGLKRGLHVLPPPAAAAPYANDDGNDARLLVAASPTDRVADSHWLRADVDHHFVRQARGGGRRLPRRAPRVDRDRALRPRRPPARPSAKARRATIRAEMIVDATGPGRPAAARPAASRRASGARPPARCSSSATSPARASSPTWRARRAPSMPAGPYPDDWAAVHHVLDEGWMYVLRFDDGLVSAGLLATPDGARRLSPGAERRRRRRAGGRCWRATLRWRAQFARRAARLPRPLRRPRAAPPGARRGRRAGSSSRTRFAFVDPLFSTGIAWSLLAVERLAEAFGTRATRRGAAGRGRAPPVRRAARRRGRPDRPRGRGRLPGHAGLRALRGPRDAVLRRGQLRGDAPAPRGGQRLGRLPGRGRAGGRGDLPASRCGGWRA